jgi:hypothetical protein
VSFSCGFHICMALQFIYPADRYLVLSSLLIVHIVNVYVYPFPFLNVYVYPFPFCFCIQPTTEAVEQNLACTAGRVQVLPPPVFHELREAVISNRWLDWEQVRLTRCPLYSCPFSHLFRLFEVNLLFYQHSQFVRPCTLWYGSNSAPKQTNSNGAPGYLT